MEKNITIAITLIFVLVGASVGAFIYTKPSLEILIYTSNSGIELMLEPTITRFEEMTGAKISYVFPEQ